MLDPSAKPYSLARFVVWTLVIGLLGIVAIALLRRDTLTPVLVVRSDVPAFHTLTADELKLENRPRDDKHRYATQAEGRITLRKLDAGAPLKSEDVGPNIGSTGTDIAIVGVAASPALVLGGALASGDRVRLIVPRGSGTVRLSALVVSVSHGSTSEVRPWTLLLALPRTTADRYGSHLNNRNLAIVRDVDP